MGTETGTDAQLIRYLIRNRRLILIDMRSDWFRDNGLTQSSLYVVARPKEYLFHPYRKTITDLLCCNRSRDNLCITPLPLSSTAERARDMSWALIFKVRIRRDQMGAKNNLMSVQASYSGRDYKILLRHLRQPQPRRHKRCLINSPPVRSAQTRHQNAERPTKEKTQTTRKIIPWHRDNKCVFMLPLLKIYFIVT